MVRQLVAALLLTFGWLLPANAGDFAERNVIGFSPDGAYFAFEEYGVQDGSGFPYSSIYVIDVKADKWVPGSPFRTRLEDEAADLLDARGETLQKAEAMLLDLSIGTLGNTVLTRYYTDLADNPYNLSFRPRAVDPPIDAAYDLTVDVYRIAHDDLCYDTGESKGYRLTLQMEGGAAVVLHEDSGSVPESRRCARDYRVHDVVTFYPPEGEPVLAIIVQYLKTGFEGPDGRFVAVTAPLPQ